MNGRTKAAIKASARARKAADKRLKCWGGVDNVECSAVVAWDETDAEGWPACSCHGGERRGEKAYEGFSKKGVQ